MSTVLNVANFFSKLPAQMGAEYIYSQPIAQLDIPHISPLYGLHLAIWQLRSQDLLVQCPPHTLEGRQRFAAWCVVHGRQEYVALRQLTPFWEQLSLPARAPESEWSHGISRFLQSAVLWRQDLGIDPELKTVQAQRDALYWFFCAGGWIDLSLDEQDLPGWQKRYLLDHPDILETRFARLLYGKRPDLQTAFKLDTAEGRTEFRAWLTTSAPQQTALPLLQKNALQAWPRTKVCSQPRNQYNPSFGVNLIGYAYAELGIGEDVRMAAHACQAAGIPFCVINVQPSNNVRQQDKSIARWVTDEPRYGINVICLTALEHLRLFIERGAELFSGRYNIGYWPWELQNWPPNWEHCFSLIDEAWASSRHIEQAMLRVAPTPVRHMPMAVQLPQAVDVTAPRHRSKFSLPEKKTLFVFSFDGNSSMARKNPVGVLDAFRLAFTVADQHVGLVIKCMRPDPQNPSWQYIQSVAQKDPRIRIIDAMLSKAEVLELYRACDCFVSLHRAEGFGRGIAEALLLGLEVIATDYGGNVDFCKPAGAYLVPSRPACLGGQDYVEAGGNQWNDPDIMAAAENMRLVANHPKPRQTDRHTHLFAPDIIGTRYRYRLSEIHQNLQITSGSQSAMNTSPPEQHP